MYIKVCCKAMVSCTLTKPYFYNFITGYVLLNVHNELLYPHTLCIVEENTELSIKQQGHLIEVSCSMIADNLVAMGIHIEVNPEHVIWPGGRSCSIENDPLASKHNKGCPLKKSVDKLITTTVLKCREDIPDMAPSKIPVGKLSVYTS